MGENEGENKGEREGTREGGNDWREVQKHVWYHNTHTIYFLIITQCSKFNYQLYHIHSCHKIISQNDIPFHSQLQAIINIST